MMRLLAQRVPLTLLLDLLAPPSAEELYATEGGAGLGTLGLPESKMRALAAEAGFSSVTRLPLDNPFNTLYALKP